MEKLFRYVKKWLNSVLHPRSKNKVYGNKYRYPTGAEAERAFDDAVKKLLDVNAWSNLQGFSSTFVLYDHSGRLARTPSAGGYIKIILPGMSDSENWVIISQVKRAANRTSFTVHPSRSPQEHGKADAPVKHFFSKEASSTFEVALKGKTVYAKEIGKNESINNQGSEGGDRKLKNTLIAKGAWLRFQKLQWEKLTEWLVRSAPE